MVLLPAESRQVVSVRNCSIPPTATDHHPERYSLIKVLWVGGREVLYNARSCAIKTVLAVELRTARPDGNWGGDETRIFLDRQRRVREPRGTKRCYSCFSLNSSSGMPRNTRKRFGTSLILLALRSKHVLGTQKKTAQMDDDTHAHSIKPAASSPR